MTDGGDQKLIISEDITEEQRGKEENDMVSQGLMV
jgi:hypothetical protein